MDRITPLGAPGPITRQARRLALAIGHGALIASIDFAIAGLGLPFGLHIALGALAVLGIEAIVHRR